MAATEKTRTPHAWKVSGMDCASCVAKVQGALEKLPGVSEVSLSLMSETLRLRLDEAQIKADAVEKRVTGLGYRIARVGEAAPATANQPGRHP